MNIIVLLRNIIINITKWNWKILVKTIMNKNSNSATKATHTHTHTHQLTTPVTPPLALRGRHSHEAAPATSRSHHYQSRVAEISLFLVK